MSETAFGEVVTAQGRRLTWVAAHLTPPVSRTTVVRWANGERRIPEHRLAELAQLLGVPLEALRDREHAR